MELFCVSSYTYSDKISIKILTLQYNVTIFVSMTLFVLISNT